MQLSVRLTPFTAPALDRALHAVMAAYVRQAGNASEAISPKPIPNARLKEIEDILLARVDLVDPKEKPTLLKVIQRRLAEWKHWGRSDWQNSPEKEPSLLRFAGTYYPPIWWNTSWPTPTSMRNVDAECKPEVTILYAQQAIAAALTQPPVEPAAPAPHLEPQPQ